MGPGEPGDLGAEDVHQLGSQIGDIAGNKGDAAEHAVDAALLQLGQARQWGQFSGGAHGFLPATDYTECMGIAFLARTVMHSG